MRRWLLAACLAVWALQTVFLAYALITDGDAEGVYLYHGYLAVTGQIGLYQDEMTGHRVPLPYYVLGLSQVLFGPSLLAGRFVSAVLGLGAIVLLWRLAAKLGGDVAGTLTVLFAVTQSYLLGYFTWATFHSLIAFLLAAGLFVLLGTDWPWKRVLATAFSTLLFFTRPLIAPLHPLALVFLLWRARGRAERLAIAATGTLPPAIFLAWDVNHLKLFTWVPGLNALVRPLGFEAVAIPYRYEADWGASLIRALWLFGRSYKAWAIAGLMLLVVWLWHARRRHSMRDLVHPAIAAVIAVVLYLAAWQLFIVRHAPKDAVGYFASFFMLLAVPLGYGFATVLRHTEGSRGIRGAVGALLALLLLLGPAASPPAALPLAVAWDRPAMVELRGVVEGLRSLIPPGSRVFLYGPPEALFMAGLRPYIQQANFLETLSPMRDDWTRYRSGLWGGAEIREWLGHDAEYAVIRLDVLRAARDHQFTESGNNVDLIESMLSRNFRRIAVLDQYLGLEFHVYRRTASDPRGPARTTRHGGRAARRSGSGNARATDARQQANAPADEARCVSLEKDRELRGPGDHRFRSIPRHRADDAACGAIGPHAEETGHPVARVGMPSPVLVNLIHLALDVARSDEDDGHAVRRELVPQHLR